MTTARPCPPELHRHRTKDRHRDDPGFHESSLKGLNAGREQRAWSTENILTAIVNFEQREGRWPGQKDFRSDNGLPSYSTLWSRFGSIAAAVELAEPLRQ